MTNLILALDFVVILSYVLTHDITVSN